MKIFKRSLKIIVIILAVFSFWAYASWDSISANDQVEWDVLETVLRNWLGLSDDTSFRYFGKVKTLRTLQDEASSGSSADNPSSNSEVEQTSPISTTPSSSPAFSTTDNQILPYPYLALSEVNGQTLSLSALCSWIESNNMLGPEVSNTDDLTEDSEVGADSPVGETDNILPRSSAEESPRQVEVIPIETIITDVYHSYTWMSLDDEYYEHTVEHLIIYRCHHKYICDMTVWLWSDGELIEHYSTSFASLMWYWILTAIVDIDLYLWPEEERFSHDNWTRICSTEFIFEEPDLAPGERVISATLKGTTLTGPVVGNRSVTIKQRPLKPEDWVHKDEIYYHWLWGFVHRVADGAIVEDKDFLPRLILTIGPEIPKDLGQKKQDPNTGVADAINVTNGNMYISISDLFIPGRGMPLSFIRTYNSRDIYSGPLGYGWTHSYNIHLTEMPDGSIVEMDEDGTRIIFTRRPDGTYQPPAGEYATLTKHPDDTYTLRRKYGTKYEFNPDGKLIQIEDRNGNIQTFAYTNGNLTTITDTSGRIINLTYDEQGRILTITNPAQRVIAYQYDANGNLISVTDPAGNITQYTYDVNHNLTVITDARGNHTYFTYNEDDRATETRNDGDNNKITLSYDIENMRTTVTDAWGNTTIYIYNLDGVCTSITDALGNTTTYTWDGAINRTSTTDANENITGFEYDEMGNLTTITDSLNSITTFTYEPTYNFVTSITDPLTHQTEYTYDEKGNLIQVKDALLNITSYEYDQFGNLIGLTDAENLKTTYDYDIYGNLTIVIDPLNNQTQFAYDILGNSTQMTDAKGNITSYTYDQLNRLTEITYPDGTKVTYTYDELGNRTSVTDPNNQTTSYAYDVVNRLTQVTDALGNITSYTYDKTGNRTAITDANNHTTTFVYDEVNRLIKTITPLGKETLYAYDPVGNRTSTTDANGNTTNYAYDVCNRLTQITYPDNTTVSFTYDATGKRISMTDHQGTTVYTYDEVNRLISVDGPEIRDTISYTYDKPGNRTSMTNQDGGITTYQYDALNRLIALTDPSGKTTHYEYDEVSNLTKMAYPNNTQAAYKYDALNRLLKLTNQGLEEIISSYAYQYDPAGMRTQVTLADCHSDPDNMSGEESHDFINYTYDEINRLISETKKKWEPANRTYYSYVYDFDPVGNRISLIRDLHQAPVFSQGEPKLDLKGKDKGKPEEKIKPSFWNLPGHSDFEYTHNEENQLTQVRIIREETTYIADYQYDNNGNLVSQKEYKQGEELKAEITPYSYDFENRLIKITYPDGTTSEYKYDGVGKRIQSIENGQITKFLYDGLSVIIERNALDITTAIYVRGISYGGGIGGIISVKRNQDIRYYLYDGTGTVTGLTDPQGNLIQSYQYDAYGNLLSSTGAKLNPYQFSTKEFSPQSGLIYFGARYYDPKVGRWVTKDPWGMVNGPNLYLYCRNNPTNRIDPWGWIEAVLGDPYRLENYAPVGEIAQIVNEAISKSSLWEAFLGQAGRNVDQTKRYIYCTDRLHWIDLQHVVSAAYAPHAEYYVYAIWFGTLFECAQGTLGWVLSDRELMESAFRTEDIMSNVLGGVAARLAKEKGISIGEMVAIMIKNAKPYNPETK